MIKQLRSTLIWGLLAVLPIAAPANAQGIMRGGLTTSTHPDLPCFYGSSYADGCSGAVASSDQQSTFFTSYAVQSGQSYSGRRPPWNVAWVDYATGYPTASPLVDIAVSQPGAPCSWSSGTRRLTCTSPSSNLTISGYDFTSGGTACSTIVFNGTVTNGITITITGNKFGMSGTGSDCQSASLGVQISQSTRTFDVVFSHNEVDGVGDTYPLSFGAAFFSVASAGGRIDVTYNHFMRMASRAVSLNSAGVQNLSFNSIDGMSYSLLANHGEFGLHATNSTTGLTAVNYSFNTMMTRNDNRGANTSLLAATQDPASNYASYQMDHNTLVSNKLSSYSSSNGATVVVGGSGWAVNDTFTIVDGCSPSATGKIASISGSAAATVTPTFGGVCVSKPTGTLATTSLSCAGGSCTGLTVSDPYTNSTAGYVITANTGVSTSGFIPMTANYVDPTGAGGCFGNSGGMTMTFSGNINLLDGSTVSNTVLANCFGRNQ